MPRKKKENTSLETIKNLSFVVIALLMVVICGLIILFFEIG